MKSGIRRRVQPESLCFENSDGWCSVFTDDLLEMVFLLLSLHDLLMMRSVCKRWQRITSAASFIRTYSEKPLVSRVS